MDGHLPTIKTRSILSQYSVFVSVSTHPKNLVKFWKHEKVSLESHIHDIYILPLQTYCHICLSNSLLLLVTVLISPPISLSVYVSVCLSLLCLTVTNLSSLLNSLRDLPENATSLLLGSLLHIEGVALNRVCEGESESAPVYSKSFPFCCANC